MGCAIRAARTHNQTIANVDNSINWPLSWETSFCFSSFVPMLTSFSRMRGALRVRLTNK